MTKVINDLLGYYNMKIVQDTKWFNFSLDSVLLSQFVTIDKNINNILDLGTGNAPIPLFLSKRTNAHIYAVDIQKDCCDLAMQSVNLNKLEDRISIINEDIKNLKKYFKDGYFDLIITNPPYFKISNINKINKEDHKAIARHEVFITLSEMVQAASYLLKNKGVFAMVHRTERLAEIIEVLEYNKLIVKKLKFIYSKDMTNSNMVLIECVKNAKRGLKVLTPTIIHNSDGSYKENILKIFEGGPYESEKF